MKPEVTLPKDEKLDWTDLKNHVERQNSGEIVLTITREKNVLDSYKKHQRRVAAKGITMEEFVKAKFMTNETDRYVLAKNDFPYALGEGVTHFVLWFNKVDKDSYPTRKEIQTMLKKEGVECAEFVCMKNTTARSVLGINHLQVFVRVG